MATFQQLVDSASVILSDPTNTRYTEAQLLEYANEAVAEVRKIRPDLFFGSYTTALSTYSLASTVPIPVEYHAYLKDFIVHRAELRDDEYSVDGRSASMMNRFKMGLLGL